MAPERIYLSIRDMSRRDRTRNLEKIYCTSAFLRAYLSS
jgi:hypothetical protein